MKQETAEKLLNIIQLQEQFGDELEISERIANMVERHLLEKQGGFNKDDMIKSILIDLKMNKSKEYYYFRMLTSNNEVLIEFLCNEWREWLKRGGDKKEFIKHFRRELDLGIYRMDKIMTSVEYQAKQDPQPTKGGMF